MSGAERHVVVGTAGHIDHGKSTIVKALTGTDPDRLVEEKLRGITIDLGFAHTTIGETTFSFIDVPGHERFVHNMLAGATGIDLVLLVIAADESVMPQTREHLDICRLLGLKSGLVALTRIDVADPTLVDVAEQEASELVSEVFGASAPVVRLSGKTGEGLDDLRAALRVVAETTASRLEGPWPRLPIDRVFAVRGFGTVVTGTLQGGALACGDELAAIPDGPRARVRGLQVHGGSVDAAAAPCRVAVNLQGVDRAELRRGMTLVPVGFEMSALVFDAELEVLDTASTPLVHGQRIRVHHGTAEAMARLRVPRRGSLAPGERGAAQVRLERPLALVPGDRFIVRRYSPVVTLAGGQIARLEPPGRPSIEPAWADGVRALARASRSERWRLLAAESAERGVTAEEDAVRAGLAPEAARRISAGLTVEPDAPFVLLAGRRLLQRAAAERLLERSRRLLQSLFDAEPLAAGLPHGRLRAELAPTWELEEFRALVDTGVGAGLLAVEGDLVGLPGRAREPTGRLADGLDRMLAELEPAGLESSSTGDLASAVGIDDDEARRLLEFAARRGRAVRIGSERWITGPAWERVVSTLRERAAGGEPEIDVPAFKRLFGLTRKNAIPLLERLDDAGVTRRAGDKRRIQRGDVSRMPGS